jgi:type IV secretion system protein VirB8
MNEHRGIDRASYYSEAQSWNRDRLQAIKFSQRIAWWVAAVASAVALFEAIALVLLTPLKTVEPYTLMVDKTTGYVQALKPLHLSAIDPDAALTQSFLVQYVIARESFDMATLRTNYRKAALFSADSARASYLASMQASSPQSPLQLYPRTTTVDVRVKSVSAIGAHAALVRFDTARADAGGDEQSPRSWVAVVQYRYARAPMNLDDRFVNPLGFQVTSYRKDPETASAIEAPSSSSGATGSTPSGYYPSFAQQALPQQQATR